MANHQSSSADDDDDDAFDLDFDLDYHPDYDTDFDMFSDDFDMDSDELDPNVYGGLSISMDQDFYIIANIHNVYRSLAVFGRRTGVGEKFLRHCHLLVRIFSHAANRLPLQQELQLADDFYRCGWMHKQDERFGTPIERNRKDPLLFPFISTCAAIGTCYDTANPDILPFRERPLDSGFDQRDNNRCITMLDITDLDNVKCSFVFMEGWLTENGSHNPLKHRRLGAREYLMHTAPLEQEDYNPETMRALDALDSCPLVPLKSLHDIFPWGVWELGIFTADHQLICHPRLGCPGLVEMSVQIFVDAVLGHADLDVATARDYITAIPRVQKLLRDELTKRGAEVSKSVHCAMLLRLAYSGEDVLDWSSFTNIAPVVIRFVLSLPEFQKVHTVNLSETKVLRHTKALCSAVSLLPRLKTLILMEKPFQIGERGCCETRLDLSHIPDSVEKVVASAVYIRPFRPHIWIPHETKPICIAPESPFVQLLFHCNSPSVTPHQFFYLGDGFLTPTRLVNGLLQFIRCFCRGSYTYREELSLAICMAAASSSSVGDLTVGEIGPIPFQTYKYGERSEYLPKTEHSFSEMRDLRPGQWTIIFVGTDGEDDEDGENGDAVFQYAFVRARVHITVEDLAGDGNFDPKTHPDSLDVFDFEGFLGEVGVSSEGLSKTIEEIRQSSTYGHMIPAREFLACLSQEQVYSALAEFSWNRPCPETIREEWETFSKEMRPERVIDDIRWPALGYASKAPGSEESESTDNGDESVDSDDDLGDVW